MKIIATIEFEFNDQKWNDFDAKNYVTHSITPILSDKRITKSTVEVAVKPCLPNLFPSAYGMPLYDEKYADYEVILVSVPAQAKIETIQLLRKLYPNLDLHTALSKVNNCPTIIEEYASKDKSQELSGLFKNLGCTMDIVKNYD
jgi:ribosomal protein L7/L12